MMLHPGVATASVSPSAPLLHSRSAHVRRHATDTGRNSPHALLHAPCITVCQFDRLTQSARLWQPQSVSCSLQQQGHHKFADLS